MKVVKPTPKKLVKKIVKTTEVEVTAKALAAKADATKGKKPKAKEPAAESPVKDVLKRSKPSSKAPTIVKAPRVPRIKVAKPKKVKAPKPVTIPLEERSKYPMGPSFLGNRIGITPEHSSYMAPASAAMDTTPASWITSYKDILAVMEKAKVSDRTRIIGWWLKSANYSFRLNKGTRDIYRHCLIPGNPMTMAVGFAPNTKGLTSEEVIKLAKKFSIKEQK